MPKLSNTFWITFNTIFMMYSGTMSIIGLVPWMHMVFMSVFTAILIFHTWLLKQEHRQSIRSTSQDTDFLPRLNPKARGAFALLCWFQKLLGLKELALKIRTNKGVRNEQELDDYLVWQLNHPGKKPMNPLLPLLVVTAFIIPTAVLLYTSPYPYLGPLLIAAYATGASAWMYWKA